MALTLLFFTAKTVSHWQHRFTSTMRPFVLSLLAAVSTFLAYGQKFEPKWVGNVVLLNIENDTTVIPLEKANIQIKTTQSAGRLLAGVGNVRQKIIVKGPHSSVQTSPDKPINLIVRCKDNENDPTSFIQVIQFEESKKERKAELASMNWLDNVSEGNMKLMNFDADVYGKSSYILRLPPLSGEFGVRVLNPNNMDERISIFYCFGTKGGFYRVSDDKAVSTDKTLIESYELDGVRYPVYRDSDGRLFIMKSKKDRYYIPSSPDKK